MKKGFKVQGCRSFSGFMTELGLRLFVRESIGFSTLGICGKYKDMMGESVLRSSYVVFLTVADKGVVEIP